MRFWVIYLLFQ